MELAKSFEPADIERRWYPEWEGRGYFAAGLDTTKEDAFCILRVDSLRGAFALA